MRFKVGQKIKVTNCYSGADFDNGDIVTIIGIGCDDVPDCYECKLNEDDCISWYLYEDEVEPVTNGDNIRTMNNDELAEFIDDVRYCSRCPKNENNCFPNFNTKEWLEKEFE